MKKYKVTYSYSIVVEAEDEKGAEDEAVEIVAGDSELSLPHNCDVSVEIADDRLYPTNK